MTDKIKLNSDKKDKELSRISILENKILEPSGIITFYHKGKPIIKIVGYFENHVIYCNFVINGEFSENHLSIILKSTFWKLFQAPIEEYFIG